MELNARDETNVTKDKNIYYNERKNNISKLNFFHFIKTQKQEVQEWILINFTINIYNSCS